MSTVRILVEGIPNLSTGFGQSGFAFFWGAGHFISSWIFHKLLLNLFARGERVQSFLLCYLADVTNPIIYYS